MKIVRHNASQIVLKEGSILGLLIAFIFCLALGGGLLVQAKGATLTCTRFPNQCLLVTIPGLFGSPQQRTISELQSAAVEGNDETYRVMLRFPEGQTPLTSFSSSGIEPKQEIVNQITEYLTNSSQLSLYVRQEEPILHWIGYGIAGVGILILLMGSYRTITFDNVSNKLTIRYVGLSVNKVVAYPLQDIQGVRVTDSTDSDGDKSYRVELQLRTEVLPLSALYTTGQSGKEAIAQEIRRFLGLRI